MEEYLKRFHGKLKPWKGSLVSVKAVEKIEKNAKEYLSKLAKAGGIERICWGWYYVEDSSRVRDFWEFAKADANFKVMAGQTAAGFWNGDFIHRNVYKVVVNDSSYERALNAFARRKGWLVEIDFIEDAEKRIPFRKIGKLRVEAPGRAVIECMQHLAFTDAFAILLIHREGWAALIEAAYWRRIAGSEVRVRQAIEYGCSRLNEELGKKLFDTKPMRMKNRFIKEEIDDAVEKVAEFA